MQHANAQVLEKFYAALTRGDVADALSHCAEQITFQVAGKSKLSGKHDRAALARELPARPRKLEVHDILASDRHAVVLATDHVARDGKNHEYRTAHVWRFENGKPVAWYEYPRDLYQFDAIWA